MRSYFGKEQETAFTKIPWRKQRPEYGIFPLHKFFYEPCLASDAQSTPILGGIFHVKLTEQGKQFWDELNTTNKKYMLDNPYKWGDNNQGICLGTYDQMLHYPSQSLEALRMYNDEEAVKIRLAA